MTAGLITEIVLGGVLLASLTYFVTKATVKRKIISKIDFMSDALDSGESAFRYSERRWADRRLNKSLNRLRSIFEAEKDSLSATLTAFVPVNDNCEINKITFKNKSDKEKKKRADGSLFCFSTIYLFLEFPATMRKRRSSCMSETASAAT